MLKVPFFQGKFALTGVNFGFSFAGFYDSNFPNFDKYMKVHNSNYISNIEVQLISFIIFIKNTIFLMQYMFREHLLTSSSLEIKDSTFIETVLGKEDI